MSEAAYRLDHPTGNCLKSRDTPTNHELWDGTDPKAIGWDDVDLDVCDHATGTCPYHKEHSPGSDDDTLAPIHVLIASFRDRLCPRTLHNLFRRAKHPDRVYVRVIEQTQPGSDLLDDAGCWDRYCSDFDPEHCHKFERQVHIVKVDSHNSKGPTDARSKLSAMVEWDYKHRHVSDPNDRQNLDLFQPVQLDDFCMQIDSHMDFSERYDDKLIAMFHRAKNERAVLSTYVADIEQNDQDETTFTVPHLCMVEFTSSIRNWATKECKHLQQPKLTNAMWGAGLSFHKCHAELAVPVDPYLDNVFDGEEGSRGLRWFTHGYDIYTPDKVLVTHDYHGHQNNPVVHTWGHGRGQGHDEKEQDGKYRTSWRWLDEIHQEHDKLTTFGTPRVNLLLNIGHTAEELSEAQRLEQSRIQAGRYGLGTQRTLEQAMEFSGIDLPKRKMITNKCGNLQWVPYDDNSAEPAALVQSILRRGLAYGTREWTEPSSQSAPAAIATPKIRTVALQHTSGMVTQQQLQPQPVTISAMAGGGLLSLIFLLVWFLFLRPSSKSHRHSE